MKKTTRHLTRLCAFLLSLCLTVSALPVWACAATTETGNDHVSLDTQTMKFRKDQQLVSTSDFTVTAKDIRVTYKGYIFIDLLIENTGSQTLTFSGSCFRTAGYHVSSHIYKEVLPGEKAEISFHFDPLALAAVGISHVDQINISFDVINKNYELLYDNCSLTIPVGADIHMDYNPREKVVYEEDAFSLTLMGSAFLEERSSPTMVFLLENHLNGPLVVRNYGNLLMNDKAYSYFISETACEESDLLFVLTPNDKFEDIFPGGGVAYYDFYLRICTELWNPLVDTRLYLGLTRSGTILQSNTAAAKSGGYESGMKEYSLEQSNRNSTHGNSQSTGENTNMFVGMFRDYEPDPQYIASLRNKYPENLARYGSSGIYPYVNELLTLYLAELDDAGFNFGVIEREDLCTETSYVVELTENGKGVIQVAFTLQEYDPKAAWIMTLGCMTDNYKDLDTLNRYLDAMWYAYDVLNVDMTPQKHQELITNSESTTKDGYVALRGVNDGLGYLYATSSRDCYLLITPDLSLSIFDGMGGNTAKQKLTEDLNVGDTFFFGRYEQDNDASNGEEDIEWVILKKEAGKVLAVSVKALESKPFNNTSGNIAWRNSSVRSWLNNNFYNTAFNREEKTKIQSQRLETMTGKDQVFLLSLKEATTYFPTAADRLCKPSVYAANHGAYINHDTGGSWWLLRTSATQSGYVVSVNSDGTVDYDGGKVESLNGTVRPAIWISTTK